MHVWMCVVVCGCVTAHMCMSVSVWKHLQLHQHEHIQRNEPKRSDTERRQALTASNCLINKKVI